MLFSTWLFKFLGIWIWCTGSDIFDIWISTLWFMKKIWVWGNIKFRAVQIQIKQLTLMKDLGSTDALLILLVLSRTNVSSIWLTLSCFLTMIWVVNVSASSNSFFSLIKSNFLLASKFTCSKKQLNLTGVMK